ncbi:MAG TPA: AmmeMemoRadiSam system radical SAM enzyme [Pirellulales bacterium]|jgi:AmmeMemoRadiSam system radical SAM enzyme/AmmeMemoRadiSam system protein B/AmmeMemoRadiSam system protein A|nr:AmmeMemoRadiSam system radical SAM enzyme [Pirellulales bacterium]
MSRIVDLPPAGLRPDGLKAGGWWHDDAEPGRIVCDLCPRACALRAGDRGFCFVRENRDGEMVLSTYGRSTGFCVDPVEKKPLNHFYPGTSILSFGTAGCNLGCKFCQNWSISKSREIEQLSEEASPEAIAEAAQKLGCRSVAFTYNDPVVWAEYAIDVASACRAAGVKTVAVTAGYISPAARVPFYEVMDAANVDLKGFTEQFYRHLTLSHLEPVLDTLRWLKHETNVWFEITNLVIPRANDSLEEIRQMCGWILDALGPDVPLHFTAFHPDFRLQDRPPTPPETLLAAYDVARSLGLKYVYAGNVHAPRQASTWCPGCGELLIERDWYDLGRYQLDGDRCRKCGCRIAGHFDARPGDWGRKRMPVRIADFAGAGRPQAFIPSAELTKTIGQGESGRNDLGSMSSAMKNATPEATTGAAEAGSPSRPQLTESQKQSLLRAAARVVAATALGRNVSMTDVGLNEFESCQVLGAFVTLKRDGRLRSCCGSMSASVGLSQAVWHAAVRSAIDDHRFPPIAPGELRYLDLDVWVLHSHQPVRAQGDSRREVVTIGKHGLQIASGECRGLLLPGVAIENKLDAESFLQQVCLKAGLPPSAWKEDHAVLSTFEGDRIDGVLHEHLDEEPAGDTVPLTDDDLARLAEFCRANVMAAVTGATPNYYAFGVSDANVNGVAVVLEDAGGNAWLQSSVLSLRKLMPLQSTIFAQAEEMGRALAARGMDAGRLSDLLVKLAVLFDPAMHGTVAAPDLRGIDATRRSLTVVEGTKSAFAWNREGRPDDLLAEAKRLANVTLQEAASIYSCATRSNAARLSVANVPRPQAGPRVRPAAVAGSFYPGDAGDLARLVDDFLGGARVMPEAWPAVMVPHAGLKYSGRLAAETLRRVTIPDSVIVISPKHTRLGVDWAVWPGEAWSIPGAIIPAEPELARQLAATLPDLQLDAAAHQQEHAIEVELPFIARLAPGARVTGIAIGSGNLDRCREFADGLAACLRGRQQATLLVISSDMNHFATDAENRRLDEMALAAMETLDAATLYDTVTRQHISMCGVLPAVIVMETLRRLGKLGRCRRVGYATSGDVTGDRSRVVGYAGMLLG